MLRYRYRHSSKVIIGIDLGNGTKGNYEDDYVYHGIILMTGASNNGSATTGH